MFDYSKVGQSINDEFWYRSQSTFLGVTGKVQANFTVKLSKNGVGNQSTTGITITEIDSTNNAGLYGIAVSGTTGFASATGEYTLTIYDTANPQYAWESTYVVTSDGNATGTVGNASFTATSGNGRITDGINPLTGATVYIKDTNGILLTSLTTNSSGIWGPVYLSQTGTYTGIAQLAAYSTVTFSITVSGSTATGPLADVALSAVSTSSTITLSSLMSYGRRMVKDAVGTKADTDLKSAINDALFMLAREKHWPWFERQSTIRLYAPFESTTGSVVFTNGSATVTLSGDTFPTTITSDWQFKANGQWHRIASRDSTTQCTLVSVWGDATTTLTAGNWSVFCDEYALPTDCARFGRIYPGTGWVWGGAPTSYEAVLSAKNCYLYKQKFDEAYAIHRDRIVLWPYPSQNINMQVFYLGMPTTLVNTSDTADWDPLHLEVLQRAIDYQLALRWGQTVSGDAGACYSRYGAALAKAMPADRSPLRTGHPLTSLSRDNYPQPRLLS
jgi:hypothetical protein